jgi:hypothetical protein
MHDEAHAQETAPDRHQQTVMGYCKNACKQKKQDDDDDDATHA